MNRPPVPLLVVTLALLVGAGASAAVGAPGPRVRPAPTLRVVPVVSATAACPQPFVARGAVTTVGVAAGSAVDAGAGTGAVAVTDLTPARRPLLRLTGTSATTSLAAGGPAVTVTASGRRAPGLSAAELSTVPTGELRGLAGTDCVRPGTDFWFVGSGAAVGQRGRLYLTNPELAPALVDVSLYGPHGPIRAPSAKGIPVAAGTQKVLLLDALAPATEHFGVHVEVRQGRVAAAVRDQQLNGLDPLGVDWVPVAAPPSTRVLIPGIPAGAGERRLQVVAPGEGDAIVRVRLLADTGPFVPTGLDVLEVPGGSVVDVDIAASARGEDVAVELTADSPVTAGLLARVGTGRQQAELAYAGSAVPLTAARPGVVPLLGGGGSSKASLVLAASRTDATVVISPLDPGTGAPVTVKVPADTQLVADLGSFAAGTSAVSVVPAPGSGPVVAARVLSDADARGPLVTVSPVTPGRYEVVVPRVSADLSTGLRRTD